MVFPGEGFDAAETLRAVSEARCTAVYGVPTMFVAMLEEAGRAGYDLVSLRTGVMAGASCPIEVMQRVIDEMHMKEVTICYGMTETSPVSFQSFVDDPIEKRVSTEVRHAGVDGEGGVCGRGAERLSYASERRHQPSFLHSRIRATTSAADCPRLASTRGFPRTSISSTAAVSCVCS